MQRRFDFDLTGIEANHKSAKDEHLIGSSHLGEAKQGRSNEDKDVVDKKTTTATESLGEKSSAQGSYHAAQTEHRHHDGKDKNDPTLRRILFVFVEVCPVDEILHQLLRAMQNGIF